MTTSKWRERLVEALEASDRSMREIALKAGMSHNYLYSILKGGAEPSIGRMMALCDEIGVSLSGILYGFDLDGDAEQLLRVYASLTRDQRTAFRALGQSMVN